MPDSIMPTKPRAPLAEGPGPTVAAVLSVGMLISPEPAPEVSSAQTSQDVLKALRERHAGDPVFVERKRDFLNLYTESDVVVATMAGQTIEYEVKISRGDFTRDRFKLRNKIYSGERPGLRPNRFFYATPEGVITAEDLPEWAGWLELCKGKLIQRRKAPKLHKDCHGVTILMRLSLAMRNRSD